jgi:hypothetical protein
MDTYKKLISFILLGIAFISSISCDDSCPTYSCNSLAGSQCSLKNSTGNYTSFIFQQCKAGQYCPYNKLTGDDSTCTTTPKPRFYPGSNCTDNTDCISSKGCENGVCKGTPNGAICLNSEECLIGFTCLKNGTDVNATLTCQPQLPENSTCEKDVDCQNSFGCHNGNCTRYFSLPEGTNTTNANLCESGFVNNGQCQLLSNVNSIDAPCDSDCLYRNSNGTNITLSGSCQCGYNKNDKKYCTLGSAHDYYKNYVNLAKKLLIDTKDCHTAERGSPLCAERLRKDKTIAFRKTAQLYGNNQVYAKNFPLLANADSCVKFVTFSGYNEDPIKPDSYKCAKFSCDKKGSSCLHSVNPFNDDGSNITVALTKGVCNSTQSCSTGPLGISTIYDKDEVNGTCVPNTIIIPKVLRYPGEACNKDTDICFNDAVGGNSTCVDNICQGKVEGENCTLTENCVVGLYCNTQTTNSTCAKQLSEGVNCTDTFDCQNNLFCYMGKCKPLGSLKNGEEVSKNTVGTFNVNLNKELACESTTLNVGNQTICVQFNYENTTASKQDSNGYVPCNWNEDCQYTDGIDKFSKKCGCGYNAEGQGYCPISHAQRKFI